MREPLQRTNASGHRSIFGGLTVVVTALAISLQAAAQAPNDTALQAKRPSVYVEEWSVAPDLRLSGRALEVALCVHLMKDKRVDSQCESDVREMLKFTADSALAGNETPAVEQLVARLQQTRWLIRGQVEEVPTKNWRLSLTAYQKGEPSTGVHLVSGAIVAQVSMEIGPEKHTQVLTFLPRLADQLLDKLLGEGSLERLPTPAPLPARVTVPAR